MHDQECVHFLKWALPKMKMRWNGFKRVRRQVCKRIDRRIDQLGLADVSEYRNYICSHRQEWKHLYSLCTVTITRFYRDIGIFDCLKEEVLPHLALACEGRAIKCWSGGCASGEEPYSLAIIWKIVHEQKFPRTGFKVVATDITPALLQRAEKACYKSGVLRNLPRNWTSKAFIRKEDGSYCLKEEIKRLVSFRLHDIKRPMKDAPFNLIMCRNLAFTYFDKVLQLRLVKKLARELEQDGILVIGSHEDLPRGWKQYFSTWPGQRKIFRKI